jgi:diacylglycerol kinase (ATP)
MQHSTNQPDLPASQEPIRQSEQVALAFNPVSGTGDATARRAEIEALAREAGLTCELEETDCELGATPLAERAVKEGRARLIVSGGDGSVTEAAHILAGTNTELAVLPAGTGNLLAINLGIPTDRASAMQLALAGKAEPIDVGRANGQVFLIAAGMGLDARMIRDADRELKDRYGKLAYFLTAWQNLRHPRIEYRITIDGRKLRRRAETVMVANLGRITAGLELVPGSDPNDGILEVAILRTRRVRDLAILGFRMVIGRPRSDDLLEIRHGQSIRVETLRPQPLELDGNDVGSTRRLDIQVEPGALKLVRPPASAEMPPVLALAATAVPKLWPRVAAVGATVGIVYGLRRWWTSSSGLPNR